MHSYKLISIKFQYRYNISHSYLCNLYFFLLCAINDLVTCLPICRKDCLTKREARGVFIKCNHVIKNIFLTTPSRFIPIPSSGCIFLRRSFRPLHRRPSEVGEWGWLNPAWVWCALCSTFLYLIHKDDFSTCTPWWPYTTGTHVACLRKAAFACHYLLPVSLLPQFSTAFRVLPRFLWHN